MGMWRNWNPYTLLVGMKYGAATLENRQFLVSTHKPICIFMAALFLIAPKWKQLKCPSADE